MIPKSLAVLALAFSALGAAAQSPTGSWYSPMAPSTPSVPSVSGVNTTTRATDPLADAAAGRAPVVAETPRPSGIAPEFQGMGVRPDSTALVVPPTGPMYLNGRVDDVRKTCPPGTIRRDYRCAPAPDQMLGR